MKLSTLLLGLLLQFAVVFSAQAKPQDYYRDVKLTNYEETGDTIESLLSGGWQIVSSSSYFKEKDSQTPIRSKITDIILRSPSAKYVMCTMYNDTTTREIKKGKLPVWCYRLN